MPKSPMKMMHEKFAVAYATTGDRHEAYRACGGKGKRQSAYQVTERWLEREDVKAKVAEVLRRIEGQAVANSAINRNWVESSLVEVINRCMQKVAVFDHEGVPVGEWKFEAASALRGLELAGKTLAMFTDKQITEDIDRTLANKTDEEVEAIRRGLLEGIGPANLKRMLAEMEAHGPPGDGPAGSSPIPDGGQAAEDQELPPLSETGGVPPGRLN